VIAGFPTEDPDAHARSLAFIAGLEPAGLHVFRYSGRPGTPATRMAGQVDERTKKVRAADLLALAAEARSRFAHASIGSTTTVLLEQRLPDGRWVGHGEDHVLVAVAPRPGDPDDLENGLVTVRRIAVDPGAPERVIGQPLHLDPAPRTLRRAIPVVASSSPGGIHAG
jgi:threonylcarbamoyladenosine tRNA methylthiotransferase MtaB